MTADYKFPGFAGPAAGFEAPLEMLAACHGRIQAQCATLRRLALHLAAHGTDAQARSAAVAVMRYFDSAALDHHADEENDLFPALLEAMAGSDAVCIRDLTARLAAEHRELEAAWAQLRMVLAEIAAGLTSRLDDEQLLAFTGLYEAHLALEEGELLPMAERLLDDAQLDAIGRAMRERRGVGEV